MSRLLRIVLSCLLAFGMSCVSAYAHEMTMAEMEVRETTPGNFMWQWSATSDKLSDADNLQLHWPAICVVESTALHCGQEGLTGELSVEGVGKRYSAALIKIYWIDGQSQVYTLTAAQSSVQLFGSAEDKRSWLQIAKAYVVLGVEHILSGVDHLLFVCGLLFLVGFRRKLLWTITAFTVAHSLTLASAALGLLTLRSPPVEATIALSIVLVAGEALHKRLTFARRWPAMVAFIFGLVHGLGFAGALKSVGLPQNHLPIALLTFNVGVELGQLLTIAVAWVLFHLLSRWPQTARARTPALYAIGSIAAYWSWLRIAAIVS